MSSLLRQRPLTLATTPDVLGRAEHLSTSKPVVRVAALFNSRIGLFVSAALISLTFLSIPKYTLDTDVDSAWSSVLAYAHQAGLQFGSDIVYPYGPLGFLLVPQFTPGTGYSRLLFDCALCLVVSTGVCLLAWRCKPAWRLLILAAFTFMAANIHAGLQDFLFEVGIMSWAVLCLVQKTKRHVLVLLLLLVVGSLAKITLLFSAALAISVLALDLLRRGKRLLALGIVGGFLLALTLLWVLLGQRLPNLLFFVQQAFILCASYDSAMALQPPGLILAAAVLLVSLAALLVFFRCAPGWRQKQSLGIWDRWLVVFWLLCCLFLSWKHGFSRADYFHARLFFAFVVVFMLLLEALPRDWNTGGQWLYPGSILGCAVAVTTLQSSFFPAPYKLESCFAQFTTNARILVTPVAYFNQMNQCLAQQGRVLALPGVRKAVGLSPLDTFGNFQMFAVLNSLNYRPRPVFQSYAAYSAPLMTINERSYLTDQAPEYVLATLQPIDQRFPPLEDAAVFRDLLMNYKLVATESAFSLLKRRSIEPPRLTLLSQGRLKPGEPIDLNSPAQATLWLQVDLQPTLLGRIRQFLYQLPQPHLAFSGLPDKVLHEFTAPAPMLAAGFVASPLLKNDEDLLGFFTGKQGRRPTACSIVFASGAAWFWKPYVRFHLYQIEPGSRCATVDSAGRPIPSGA